MSQFASEDIVALVSEHRPRLDKNCPELRALPKDWSWGVASKADNYRIFFGRSGQNNNYVHPTLGRLPGRWILKVRFFDGGKRPEVVYHDRETGKDSVQDPRFTESAREIEKISVKGENRGALHISNMVKNRGQNIQTWSREKVSHDPSIRERFQIIHIIDIGGGEEGAIGGMNGGIFVCRIKGVENRLFVEKRFKEDQVTLGKSEIDFARRCIHHALTVFTASYIDDAKTDASLWVEFADRGSLDDIKNQYIAHRDDRPTPQVPEPFVWHAFIGLCDALMYLKCGKSHFNSHPPPKNWVPILHRDIKPDNVLLRSRTTLGVKRYFYVILSDFGLAGEDWPEGHANQDQFQKTSRKFGTMKYLAPELLWTPYPKTQWEENNFPNGQKHSCKSDLWSLAVSIFDLCCAVNTGNWVPHYDHTLRKREMGEKWYMGNHGLRPLTLPNFYSRELREAIQRLDTPTAEARPDAQEYMKILTKLAERSGLANDESYEALPDWATRVHEYHNNKGESIEVLKDKFRKKLREKKRLEGNS